MITIGGILEKLYAVQDKSVTVVYDFCDIIPTKIASWRGVYAEPALGWKCWSCKDSDVTVSKLIEELEKAVDGRMYFGWKGGEYFYTKANTLHVDNPGELSRTSIFDVCDEGWRVILITNPEG